MAEETSSVGVTVREIRRETNRQHVDSMPALERALSSVVALIISFDSCLTATVMDGMENAENVAVAITRYGIYWMQKHYMYWVDDFRPNS